MRLRAGPGPEREAWLSGLAGLLPPGDAFRRLPSATEDERLLGGLDLSATLALGRPVIGRGALSEADGGVLVLAMAERLTPATGARIAAAMDQGEVQVARDGQEARHAAAFGLILLDEGASEEERPPEALLARCALHLALPPRLPAPGVFGERGAIAAARTRLGSVAAASAAVIEALCRAALALGLVSPREVLLALQAARASAALAGRSEASAEDAALAVRLVLRPRSELDPQTGEARAEPEPPRDPPAGEAEETDGETEGGPAPSELELVLEAVRAALPPGLLDLAASPSRSAPTKSAGDGAGSNRPAARRGRPAGSRPGRLRPGARLDLVATLKAAAPMRRLRAAPPDARLPIRAEDFRVRRFIERREATAIFAVDASGSAALQRLGEAKGAVELLLADAYVSRTRAALIAFRGSEAEILLPPTRSLARARRRLADLAGGGGTPLAAALERALDLGLEEVRRGRTPFLVLLTDGRANIDRSGAPGRPAAAADALRAAEQIRAAGLRATVIDTSPRPSPEAERCARAMNARYLPLPVADAEALGALVGRLRADAQ